MVKTINNSVGVSDWYRVIELLKRVDNLQRIANGVSLALKVSTLTDNFFKGSGSDTAAATISVVLDTRNGNCYVIDVEPIGWRDSLFRGKKMTVPGENTFIPAPFRSKFSVTVSFEYIKLAFQSTLNKSENSQELFEPLGDATLKGEPSFPLDEKDEYITEDLIELLLELNPSERLAGLQLMKKNQMNWNCYRDVRKYFKID